jgi:AraC family transcriptional regulator of arabinose operon
MKIHRPLGRLRCGQQTHAAHTTQQLETPQYAFVYFIRGHGSYQSGNQNIPFGPGSVVQRFPNRLHRVHFESECESLYAAIPAAGLQLLHSFELETLNKPVFEIGLDDLLIKRFQQLGNELRSHIPQLHVQVAGKLIELIIDVHSRASAIYGDPAQDSFVHKACALLQQDLSRDVDLPGVVSDLHMTYINFRKRFKSILGISPGQFRIQQRIEEAKQELLQGKSINEVSQILGYPDCYSFSKQFKKVSGLPPREYVRRKGFA